MARRSSTPRRTFILGGLLVALLLALVVSGFASGSPDGLERVAEDHGFIGTATDHAFSEGPIADYAIRGIGNERLSTGLAGVLGVLITFAVGIGVAALVRRRDRAAQQSGEPAHPDEPHSRPRSGGQG